MKAILAGNFHKNLAAKPELPSFTVLVRDGAIAPP